MNASVQRTAPSESLAEALERVYGKLHRAAENSSAPAAPPALTDSAIPDGVLKSLQATFGLSAFELDLLVLCFGSAVESRFLTACSAAHANPQATWPTFGLALAVLDNPHWSAISRARPLRYWSLIDVARTSGGSTPLLHTPLQIDERILQYMMGVPALEERLEPIVTPLATAAGGARPVSRNTQLGPMLEEGLRYWRGSGDRGKPILLTGDSKSSRETAFQELCRRGGLSAYQINAADLPAVPEERRTLARLWMRESALQHAALLVHCTEHDNLQNLSAWLELLQSPIAVDAPPGSPAEHLRILRMDVPALSAEERRTAWVKHLGEASAQLNGSLERLVDYFHFDEATIQSAAASALAKPPGAEDIADITWRACRQQGRRSLDTLARRLESRATWSQLVLPEAQTATLRQIAVHMRQRGVVNQQWGFAERYSRGHGLSALFSGGSGTGKTMAAEILARELNLDLYQIDLASMVSKYIGETEKNLRRVFDAAEESGAVLLFDECDALFGKRSEVRDSHDRYANLEISYLLQRMDNYRGVAILTTNMQHAIDGAFLRRIRFIVPFPFPDAPSRARIWQGIFPTQTPVSELDFERFAQLNVSGGVIRNIAIHAAFLAAEAATAVCPQHILAASRLEYSKIDRPLTAAETKGWS